MSGPRIHEYAFDITLLGAVRVKACDEATARRHLAERLDAAEANLGCWMDGAPILAEVSLVTVDDDKAVGPPRLYEIDGESVGTVAADCDSGLHSWLYETGSLHPDTPCAHCGTPYGSWVFSP